VTDSRSDVVRYERVRQTLANFPPAKRKVNRLGLGLLLLPALPGRLEPVDQRSVSCLLIGSPEPLLDVAVVSPTMIQGWPAARHALGHDITTRWTPSPPGPRPCEIRQGGGRRLIQRRDRPRDAVQRPSPRTRGSTADRRGKNGRRQEFSPGGQFRGRPSPCASGSARAVNPSPVWSTSSTLRASPARTPTA